jgi:YD repeat-containing protein
VSLFQWCRCGDLRTLTDPMGRTTTWRHDVQGRVKCKEYADGSKVTYRYENSTRRLRQKIDEKLQVTQYSYNRDDTVSRISYTNVGVVTPSVAFTYDPNYNRLSSMTGWYWNDPLRLYPNHTYTFFGCWTIGECGSPPAG